MRSIFSVTCFLLLLVTNGYAQAETRSQGTGYLFFAPGIYGRDHSGAIQFGGGGNYRSSIGLGGGLDASYLAPWSYTGEGIGTFSPYLYYSYLKKESRIEPFLSGGYTLFFRSSTANGINFGGGIHFWFNRKIALKLEFRDDVMLSSYQNIHVLGFRMGVAFR